MDLVPPVLPLLPEAAPPIATTSWQQVGQFRALCGGQRSHFFAPQMRGTGLQTLRSAAVKRRNRYQSRRREWNQLSRRSSTDLKRWRTCYPSGAKHRYELVTAPPEPLRGVGPPGENTLRTSTAGDASKAWSKPHRGDGSDARKRVYAGRIRFRAWLGGPWAVATAATHQLTQPATAHW